MCYLPAIPGIRIVFKSVLTVFNLLRKDIAADHHGRHLPDSSEISEMRCLVRERNKTRIGVTALAKGAVW